MRLLISGVAQKISGESAHTTGKISIAPILIQKVGNPYGLSMDVACWAPPKKDVLWETVESTQAGQHSCVHGNVGNGKSSNLASSKRLP